MGNEIETRTEDGNNRQRVLVLMYWS